MNSLRELLFIRRQNLIRLHDLKRIKFSYILERKVMQQGQ